jgi:2-polyprenyl-6-methoxyphenol hydroxylase-like FAD-dependent oxidoreductase
MQHEATGLVFGDDRVAGVRVQTPNGPTDIRADLVIWCDGRHSIIRQAAHFEVLERGVPIDVLWFRITRRGNEPEQLFGNINYGKILILIPRDDYFQAALLIRKGSFEEVKTHGMESFRENVRQIAPYLGDRLDELKDWDQIKLLSVQINRLRQWYRPGLLCIGDAAHAMSPAGGVGINLAIQDAVATANLLSEPLREGRVTEADLALVQQRREFPTRVTQQLQVFAHKGMERIFAMSGPAKAPWQLKVIVRIPGIQRITALAIGLGVRPEHVSGARKTACHRTKSVRKIIAGLGIATAVFAVTLMARRRTGPERI